MTSDAGLWTQQSLGHAEAPGDETTWNAVSDAGHVEVADGPEHAREAEDAPGAGA